VHIPDGFLDGPTALATAGVSAAAVGYAARRAGQELGERTVPLLGVTAAFVFAAQMINFPVAGGTSGHLMGGVLAAVLMGPWAAGVVMTVVVTLQALGMADGGVTALGANILNMAVIGGMLSYLVFLLLRSLLRAGSGPLGGGVTSPSGGRRTRFLVAVGLAAWFSIVASAAAASLQLAASGTMPLRVGLPAMVGVHTVIGLGEALITTLVVAAVLASRPDLVGTWARRSPANGAIPAGGQRRTRRLVFTGLALALVASVLVSPFASSLPDGLERVALDQGVEEAAAPTWNLSPLPDYSLPWLEGSRVGVALAGLLGTLGLFALVLMGGRLLARGGGVGGSPPRPDIRPASIRWAVTSTVTTATPGTTTEDTIITSSGPFLQP
jgi:cobalt/nickel transport system permease protein